jgi:hypothetical protein
MASCLYTEANNGTNPQIANRKRSGNSLGLTNNGAALFRLRGDNFVTN